MLARLTRHGNLMSGAEMHPRGVRRHVSTMKTKVWTYSSNAQKRRARHEIFKAEWTRTVQHGSPISVLHCADQVTQARLEQHKSVHPHGNNRRLVLASARFELQPTLQPVRWLSAADCNLSEVIPHGDTRERMTVTSSGVNARRIAESEEARSRGEQDCPPLPFRPGASPSASSSPRPRSSAGAHAPPPRAGCSNSGFFFPTPGARINESARCSTRTNLNYWSPG